MNVASCMWTGCERASCISIIDGPRQGAHAKASIGKTHTATRKGPAAWHYSTCCMPRCYMPQKYLRNQETAYAPAIVVPQQPTTWPPLFQASGAIVSIHEPPVARPCDRPGPCYWTIVALVSFHSKAELYSRHLLLFPWLVSFQGGKLSVASTTVFCSSTFTQSPR